MHLPQAAVGDPGDLHDQASHNPLRIAVAISFTNSGAQKLHDDPSSPCRPRRLARSPAQVVGCQLVPAVVMPATADGQNRREQGHT